MNSCIYNGEVTHTRFKPVRHFLKYKTFSLLIDLDEIDKLDSSINIFSHNKFNIFSFYDKDHGERDGSDLKEWVLKNISKFNIKGEINKVKILCYPRIFGYVFNPLSIFYCYENNKLKAIFYEVKNTFNEQHTYIFKIKENSVIKKVNFTHPYLNSKNTALQKDLRLIQGKKRTWFCGSYFGYGFHEDGLKSSIDLINNFKI